MDKFEWVLFVMILVLLVAACFSYVHTKPEVILPVNGYTYNNIFYDVPQEVCPTCNGTGEVQ